MSEMKGGCACGRVRYTAQIDNDDAYLCHCRMCQRATGSVSIAFKNVRKADVAWEGEPDWYQARRSRGGPIAATAAPRSASPIPDSEKMDLTVAVLRRSVAVPPDQPFRRGEHAPRLAEHRRPAGVSHATIISRWSSAGPRRPARCRAEAMRFHHPAVPIVLAIAADRFDRLRHRPAGAARSDRPSRPRLAARGDADRRLSCWSPMPARNSSPGRCLAILATASAAGRSCSSRRSPSRSIIC